MRKIIFLFIINCLCGIGLSQQNIIDSLQVVLKTAKEDTNKVICLNMLSRQQLIRDAGEENCDYECTILDCLRGLVTAICLGWYTFNQFDYKSYEYNHKLSNGDMNWVIPK